MDIAELDELVEQLDTQISQLDVTDSDDAPSLLLCSLSGCGYSYHYPYC